MSFESIADIEEASLPFSVEESGRRLHEFRDSGFFERISIDENAMAAVLADYLQTGNEEAALTFFDRNYDPNLTKTDKLLNGREAFRQALDRLYLSGDHVPTSPKELDHMLGEMA